MKLEARGTPGDGVALVLTDTTAANSYARTLADARDAAEAANRAKTEFLANMSHELRTPLNGVLGIAEALARTDLDRRQTQMLDIIRDNGGALEGLLSDLLDLAHAEAGDIVLDPQPVSVAELCGATVALFAERWRPPRVWRSRPGSTSAATSRCSPTRYVLRQDPEQPRQQRGEVHARRPGDLVRRAARARACGWR